MAFTEMTLKETYDSDEDHILNDFYIPILANSVQYDRLAGYYSSTALAASAKGMAQFLQNRGKMRLVTSIQISTGDQKAIMEGLNTPEEVIARMMETDLNLADRLKTDHLAALAWMLAEKTLEIKVVVPLTKEGEFDTKCLDYSSIYHQKIGILYDSEKNIVSFSGSINETGKAWNENVEEFKVFCSWKPGQDKYGAEDAKRFEKFWYGRSSRAVVFDLPAAIRQKLIQSAPKTEAEAVLKLNGNGSVSPPRSYQIEAADKWFDNNRRGILEMATGTGKTRTAIDCIRRTFDMLDDPIKLVVVSCPYLHLVSQWVDDLRDFNIEALVAHGGVASWPTRLSSQLLRLSEGIRKNMVLVTTHDTLSSEKFTKMIKQCDVQSLIVADEVHRLGAEQKIEGLIDVYNDRLGLSATPERYFDDDGTRKIFEYFGGKVFEFSLNDAIKKGHLTEYKLFPHVAYLSNEEMAGYRACSRQYAIESSKKEPNKKILQSCMFRRADIIRSASSKLDAFENILNSIEKLDHCLVYCSAQQLDSVSEILHRRKIMYHRFTYKETEAEKTKLLSTFSRGDTDVLLAIKCLDEGVDVPATKTAIILASSGNPAEFVQRRGRVLRPSEGKNHAVIHDVVALPPYVPINEVYTEREEKILEKEFKRLEEFASSASNPKYTEKFIQDIKVSYRGEY